jgi:hypothetical protein
MGYRRPWIQQRGFAVVFLVLTLSLGGAAVFYSLATAVPREIERDRKTAEALALAKAALIGYAAGVSNFAGNARLGDLPCPDRNDSGSPGGTTATSCGNAAGNQQARRLGRLPWKILGLPDLRDGDGERLWYAVSNNFKNNVRTACTTPGQTGCLNSDTRGTITVRDASGTVIHNGANPDPYSPSGVVAVIIAPGAILKRQGAASAQSRTCTGGTCTATGVCLTNPESVTPKCDPANFLDTVAGIEDNADFIDNSATNGFINGIVRDSSGNVIVNDRVITITYQDLMPKLEYRVAMETLNCLRSYATFASNNGRYPWANPANSASTSDQANTFFGQLPGTAPFLVEGYFTATTTTAPMMPNLWPINCGLKKGTWWNNWREQVFYAIADAYKPGVGAPTGCSIGSCLSVNPPSATANKQLVVLVAGQRLAAVAGGQPRVTSANKQNPANYFEGNMPPLFTRQPRSALFNDTVVFYPP